MIRTYTFAELMNAPMVLKALELNCLAMIGIKADIIEIWKDPKTMELHIKYDSRGEEE